MDFLKIEKVKDGKYLKNYELTYLNKAGKEKVYEMVSRSDIASVEEIGSNMNGVSIVAFCDGKLLLLKEFRMGVNKTIYNLCAGMIEKNEPVETCIERELFEETGLKLKRIIDILPPSFAAVGISDTKTSIAIVEAEGAFSDYHTSVNEEIQASFYTKEECKRMLQTEEFSSRSQLIAYFFTKNLFDKLDN